MPRNDRGQSSRKFPRAVADFSCAISRIDANGAERKNVRGRVRSLGLGGLAIETEAALALDESLQILFMIDGQRIEATAQVVFVRRSPGGRFENGVRFTSILDEHRDFLLATMLLKNYRSIDEPGGDGP